MCRACRRPSADHARYVERLAHDAGRDGWALHRHSRPRPAVVHTVGLTAAGQAELLVTGLEPDHARALVVGALGLLADPPEPEPGRVLRVHGRRVELVAVGHPELQLCVASAVLDGDAAVRALQLVWADGCDHFPWDPSHRRGAGGQPVLGPRSRSAAVRGQGGPTGGPP